MQDLQDGRSIADANLSASSWSRNRDSRIIGSTEERNVTRRSVRVIAALYTIVALLSLWLKQAFPAWILGNAVFDDELFRRQAEYLFAGQWLGPYDKLTLIKGMFYPLFIAASAWIGLPLKIAEHFLYLAVCLLTAKYVERKSENRLWGLLTFAVLAFNPVFWTPSLARVIREAIYLSLSLAVLVLSVMAAFPVETTRPTSSARLSRAFAAGLVLGCFWLTREEGVWILPAIFTVICLTSLRGVIASRVSNAANSTASLFRLAMFRAVVPIAIATVGFGLVTGTVRVLNLRHYGTFELTEFQGGSFLKAYGALARIHHDNWQRFVVFPKDARLRAYKVSAAARELKPSLDGPNGERWRQIGCSQTQTSPCPEILSGWFMWALRDAANAADHHKSAQDASRFYDRLADEINSACDADQISCTARRATLIPPFRWTYLPDALKASTGLFRIIFRSGDGQFGSPTSQASDSQMAYFQDMVGIGSPTSESTVTWISGWAAGPGAAPDVSILDAQGKTATIRFDKAPDVETALPGLSAVRFDAALSSPVSEASLVVQKDDFSAKVALRPGKLIDSPQATVLVDSITESGAVSQSRQRIQEKLAHVIQHLYLTAGPVLSVIAAIGLLLGIPGFLKGKSAALFVLASASLVATGTRIALLSYLEVTSMPAVNLLYASPALPFALLFTVIGIYVGLQALKGFRAPNR
ncbi:hypothetical protein EVC45_04605 [Paraburkholderia sp. UYCP14C]|uniref:hypothetical protein n=1 Tax=Paraburkholderia sp. UYCP14C TaxID=2511130 RepID=UPI00101E8AD2|nr:hypothetical protein [Paraburkholderia sp. UYCP14C]RZF30748.1 hypothetical protein EVC45_04605 [Paraburkholderia sp. UYCP14C]